MHIPSWQTLYRARENNEKYCISACELLVDLIGYSVNVRLVTRQHKLLLSYGTRMCSAFGRPLSLLLGQKRIHVWSDWSVLSTAINIVERLVGIMFAIAATSELAGGHTDWRGFGKWRNNEINPRYLGHIKADGRCKEGIIRSISFQLHRQVSQN